jgi:benzoyl-CoA reductase/2-hydroxyglutaryl-CoA dehydratase subunit BcrC/BadD/HgdB
MQRLKSEMEIIQSSKRKKIGYFCSYTPVEVIYAAGLHPIRIFGLDRPIQNADTLMHSNICPYVRSILDRLLESGLDSFDGFVFVNSCDAMRRLYELFRGKIPEKFYHLIDLPKNNSPDDIKYLASEFNCLAENVEKHFEKKIDKNNFENSIELYNNLRNQLITIDQLRLQGDLKIKGSEFLKLINYCSSEDPEIAIKILKNEQESYSRDTKEKETDKSPRIILTGNIINHPEILELIEKSGAWIVGENLCTGLRFFYFSIDTKDDLMVEIARAYMNKPPCARMMDEEFEINEIVRLINKCNADGVLYHSLKFCDTYLHSIPKYKKLFKEKNIKALFLEGDYTTGSFGQLQTRIEAFLEML